MEIRDEYSRWQEMYMVNSGRLYPNEFHTSFIRINEIDDDVTVFECICHLDLDHVLITENKFGIVVDNVCKINESGSFFLSRLIQSVKFWKDELNAARFMHDCELERYFKERKR